MAASPFWKSPLPDTAMTILPQVILRINVNAEKRTPPPSFGDIARESRTRACVQDYQNCVCFLGGKNHCDPWVRLCISGIWHLLCQCAVVQFSCNQSSGEYKLLDSLSPSSGVELSYRILAGRTMSTSVATRILLPSGAFKQSK
jgi:hypothetical protein